MNTSGRLQDKGNTSHKGARRILLDFGTFSLTAALFDTPIADAFFDTLPVSVDLIAWGEELYGSIGADLGNNNPQPRIPAGGLAYTNRGNYFCIFFGQDPAWPVEFIGAIEGEEWQKLRVEPVSSVQINPLP